MHRQHFDFNLICELARKKPSWQFWLVGPVMTPWRFPSNVELLGPQPHSRLRDYLSEANLIILPYVINDYTSCVFPAKTYECLATGLPIVSTPLPELVSRVGGFIRFGSNADEFGALIEDSISSDRPELVCLRVDEALRNTWSARYQMVRGLLVSECG